MPSRTWNIGIVGTFDVQNYGDLLFPIIAQRELEERLGKVNLVPLSYERRSDAAWPFDVASIADLPEILVGLDGLLVGGGFLVRFDKDVAPGYGAPPGVHHPSGYWLTPSLLALQHDVPLIWNAPGMHCNDIPAWAEPLIGLVASQAAYLAVRDSPSRNTLLAAGVDRVVEVPDTAFGLARMAEDSTSVELKTVLNQAGIVGPYVVVQAALSSQSFMNAVTSNRISASGIQFLALPIGPVLGDHPNVLANLPGVKCLDSWPDPLLLAEVVRHAEAVVGHSYHLLISAACAGVPGLATEPLDSGKYKALSDLGIHGPAAWLTDDFSLLLGRRARPTSIDDRLRRLELHWDHVAEAIQAGNRSTRPALDRFWQGLPSLLEESAQRSEVLSERLRATIAALETKAIRQDERLLELEAQIEVNNEGRAELTAEVAGLRALDEQRGLELVRMEAIGRLARAENLARYDEVAGLLRSRSWRVTAPLRRLAQRFGRPEPIPSLLDFRQLLAATLCENPWEFVEVRDLFPPAVLRSLAEHCPTDHFRRVVGYGGEKDYSYDSREVVPFGKNAVSHASLLHPLWRALAADLLSPQYRSAMSLLSGLDLTGAALEVNLLNYQAGDLLGPHVDLPEKLVTHDIFVTADWPQSDGGCLRILRSPDQNDVHAELLPEVGNSVVLKRSDHSWHSATRVSDTAVRSRRVLTATFYQPGSISHMWPQGESVHVRNLSVDGRG